MSDAITYSESQQLALDAIMNPDYRAVFVTGKAGTGKSLILRASSSQKNAVITAPTGLAAMNVGGSTIHSFFGIKPGQMVPQALNMWQEQVVRAASLILIDEISMVRADLLDMVDDILRKTLRNDLPFGGKKVVMFGDPLQIEPVVSTDEERQYLDDRYRSPFFFDSKVYRQLIETGQLAQVELTHVFRQSDPDFLDALNAIREQDYNRAMLILNRHVNPSPDLDQIQLVYTNRSAEIVNGNMMNRIEGEEFSFTGTMTGHFGRDLPVELEIRLKVGARVMLVANNWEDGYVNGDMGVVSSIRKVDGMDVVSVDLDRGHTVQVKPYRWEKIGYDYDRNTRTIETKVLASLSQLPIKLAWAITVHKSQGQSYDATWIALDRPSFAHGLAYVALSRCRNLNRLTIARPLNARDFMFSPRVVQWMEEELRRSA
jgi:ATP-dependent exoDNAse (exonuclease V) alpha subunit